MHTERREEYILRHGLSRRLCTAQRHMGPRRGQFGMYSPQATSVVPALACLSVPRCGCHATACVPCHDALQLKLTATLTQLQLLHVDIHELAKSYKHVEKVASDVMDALVDLGVRGEYGDRPTPLNQTQSWQRIKALVAFVDTHMKGIQPQGANPPGFPSTVLAMQPA